MSASSGTYITSLTLHYAFRQEGLYYVEPGLHKVLVRAYVKYQSGPYVKYQSENSFSNNKVLLGGVTQRAGRQGEPENQNSDIFNYYHTTQSYFHKLKQIDMFIRISFICITSNIIVQAGLWLSIRVRNLCILLWNFTVVD